jgi:hypothetical protein
MKTDAIRGTAFELSEISRKLSKIELLGSRRMTLGRAREIVGWFNALCCYDATDLMHAESIGVNLPVIVQAGLDQLQVVIDNAHDVVAAAEASEVAR